MYQAIASGVLGLAVGAVVVAGGFLAPHALAGEATVVRHGQMIVLRPFGVLPALSHHVLIVGHTALKVSLHYAFVPVHACFHLISSLFGL